MILIPLFSVDGLGSNVLVFPNKKFNDADSHICNVNRQEGLCERARMRWGLQETIYGQEICFLLCLFAMGDVS